MHLPCWLTKHDKVYFKVMYGRKVDSEHEYPKLSTTGFWDCKKCGKTGTECFYGYPDLTLNDLN